MSYPRHEYFRRILCNLIGRDIQTRAIPTTTAWSAALIKNICYANAKSYLAFPGVELSPAATRTRRSTLNELQCKKTQSGLLEENRHIVRTRFVAMTP